MAKSQSKNGRTQSGVIKKCGCDGLKNGNVKGARFQDQKYGLGNRLYNGCMKADTYRCTICEKLVTSTTKEEKPKGKK